MKKAKHSKYKNTGVLFELLIRQLTSDILHDVKESVASSLVKKYFNKNSELSKELALYQTLIKEHFNTDLKAETFLNTVINARKKLNNTTLTKQKYNLIKEIRDSYNIEDFFTARVNDYKVLASIYKLFEFNSDEMPAESVNSRYTIIEHIVKQPSKSEDKITELTESYKRESKEIRLLAYRLLVDKFNQKYGSTLSEQQKGLLNKYINNVSNTTTLKEYVNNEIATLSKQLLSLNKHVDDKVVKIKITEAINILETFKKGAVVRDEEVLSLLRYYELVNELKSVTGAHEKSK